MIRYARVLIDMKLEGDFPDYIDFFNEQDILIRQKIQYEWLPVKCLCCGMYGHKEEVCKKKDGPKKVWRVKKTNTATEESHTPETEIAASVQAEDRQKETIYTKVIRGPSAESRTRTKGIPRATNPYQILAEENSEQGIMAQTFCPPILPNE